MIIYLLKFLACSGILLIFYHFVLQSDRLFKFNRVFLLSIVGLALLIPITTVRTNYIEIPAAPALTYETPAISDQSFQAMPKEEFITEAVQASTITTEQILIGSYLLITLLLLIRFGRNLYAINRLKMGSDIVQHSGIKVVLRSDISTSFSFLNYMFTNKERYEQGNLPVEIIQHEKLHIKQQHSIDIICIELLQCFFWFNPFIYLIKKAIKLNHEFLADAFVLGGNTSAYTYQKILLDFTGKQILSSPLFASNLNYGFTKKRLNMMVKNTNLWSARLKQVAALAIITITFWMLGITETVAQEVERKQIRFTTWFEIPIIDKSKTSNPNGPNRMASLPHTPFLDNPLIRYELDGLIVEVNMDDFTYEERVKVIEGEIKLEYKNKTTSKWNTIGISYKPEQDKKEEPINKPEIQQYKSDTTKRPIIIRIGAQETSKVRFLMEDGQKVEKLLKDLSTEEYKRFKDPESRSEFFLPPVPKVNTSQTTLNEFLDVQVYGLWIDGKKVNNSELKKYKPSDIHHYRKDKLYRGAKKDQGYTHQLNITTNEHFNNSSNVNGKWILSTPTEVSNHKRQNDKVKQDNRPSPPFKLNQVRFKNNSGKIITKKFSELSESEKKRFRTKASNPEYYVPKRPKIIMNQSMLDDFRNAEKYGVILDGKMIKNNQLNNYKPEDVHDFRKEKPTRGDKDLGKYEFRLYMSTEKYFKSLPEFKTGWLPYGIPRAIEAKSVKQEAPEVIEVKSVREEEMKEKPEAIEVKSVREEKMKEEPEAIEVKSVREVKRDSTNEKPQVIRVKSVRQKNIKDKSEKEGKRKNSLGNEKFEDSFEYNTQELGVKKGGFNPQLHSPGIDLDKVEYFLVPTRSTHMKYLSKNGEYVIKTLDEMDDKEYSRWINPIGEGQIFNPPAAKVKITRRQLYDLKDKRGDDIWVNGKKVDSQTLASLEYYNIYDMDISDTKVAIVTDIVFLKDDSAWMSRIRYKKIE